MKERHLKLVEILSEHQNSFIDGAFLAKRLSVSTRTIRSDIKEINANNLIDAQIISNTHKGYRLKERVQHDGLNLELEMEERMFQIIKYLLQRDSLVSYEEISNELFYSTQTIRKETQKIFQKLSVQNRDIEIRATVFKGIQLYGSEIDKRLVLESLLPKEKYNRVIMERKILHYFNDWISAEDLRQLIHLLDTFDENNDLGLDAYEFFKLAVHLIIMLYRIRQGNTLQQNDIALIESVHSIEMMSRDLLEQVAVQMGIRLNDVEIHYFVYLLISLQITPAHKEETQTLEKQGKLFNNLERILKKTDKVYDLNLSEDESFKNGIYWHLTRIMNPIKYHFSIENPFMDYIKLEHFGAYNIAVFISKQLELSENLLIPENEIGYLSLYIANALTKMNQSIKKVAIVYRKKRIVGKLLLQKLELYFPEIKVEGIYSFNEIERIPSEVKWMICVGFMDNSVVSKKKQIYIHERLSEEDIKRISNKLNKGLAMSLVAKHSFYLLDAENKLDLLNQLSAAAGVSSLFKSILEREDMSSTDIGNGVALPHAFESAGNDEMQIFVGINAKPIQWSEENDVQLVLLFIPPGKSKTTESLFFSEVYEVVKNEHLVEELIQSKTFSEFRQLWNS